MYQAIQTPKKQVQPSHKQVTQNRLMVRAKEICDHNYQAIKKEIAIQNFIEKVKGE